MRKLILLFSSFLALAQVDAQVGVGTDAPATTLDIRAANHNGALSPADGLALPRVNSLGQNGIEEGQLIYLTAEDPTNGYLPGLHFWENNTWNSISTGASGGKGQIYSGSWYVGNITSTNDVISDIKGIIDSITVDPDYSSGATTSYNVVLDDNYLIGNFGTDFQIISELTTNSTGGDIRRDTRVHRVSQKTGPNSFRLTMRNLESSSSRNVGVTIAIIRTAETATFERSKSDLGSFTNLLALNNATNPNEGDQATINEYDPTLVHIGGAIVPNTADKYTLVYDGTSWEYTGWSSNITPGIDWIEDASGLVLSATGTAPTKASNTDIDLVRYRELGNNYVEVEMRYAATDKTGSSSGSGEYLFTLPNSYQFDATQHPIYTGSGTTRNSIAASYSLETVQSQISRGGINGGSEALPIPYNSTQFRALLFSGDLADNYVNATTRYALDEDNCVYILRFTFKRQ